MFQSSIFRDELLVLRSVLGVDHQVQRLTGGLLDFMHVSRLIAKSLDELPMCLVACGWLKGIWRFSH